MEPRSLFGIRDIMEAFPLRKDLPTPRFRRPSIAWRQRKRCIREKRLGNVHVFEALIAATPHSAGLSMSS